MHFLDVLFKIRTVAVTFRALVAPEGPPAGVDHLVPGQVVGAVKAPPTRFTCVLIGANTKVHDPLVTDQVVALGEALVANRARELLLLGVGDPVVHEVRPPFKRLLALFALETPLHVDQCVLVVFALISAAVVAMQAPICADLVGVVHILLMPQEQLLRAEGFRTRVAGEGRALAGDDTSFLDVHFVGLHGTLGVVRIVVRARDVAASHGGGSLNPRIFDRPGDGLRVVLHA